MLCSLLGSGINSKNDMIPTLNEFSSIASTIREFECLDWDVCVSEFGMPVESIPATFYEFSLIRQTIRGFESADCVHVVGTRM